MGASYVFGVLPSSDPEKLNDALSWLSGYLAQVTGDDFSVVVTKDYEELLIRMKEGSVDLACLNTVGYIKLRKDIPNVKYVGTFLEKDDEDGSMSGYYRSYIVSLKDRGFSSIKDLEGGTFAFVSRDSTSSVYAKYALRKMGIDPFAFFGKAFYLNRHDRVVKSLLAGSVDAGAISQGMYRNAVETFGDVFDVLVLSEPIPHDLMVASRSFPTDKVELYRKALIQLSPDYEGFEKVRKALGWGALGFGVFDESFYDRAEEIINADI